jgi:hypothetical protein
MNTTKKYKKVLVTQHSTLEHNTLLTKGIMQRRPLLHVSNVEEHAILVGLLEFFLGGLLGKCECIHGIRTIEPDEPSNFSLDGVSELVAE